MTPSELRAFIKQVMNFFSNRYTLYQCTVLESLLQKTENYIHMTTQLNLICDQYYKFLNEHNRTDLKEPVTDIELRTCVITDILKHFQEYLNNNQSMKSFVDKVFEFCFEELKTNTSNEI